MKQTKLEALKTCRKLWQVEADHGAGDKEKMFNLAGLNITDFDSGCPACEYDFTHSRGCFSGENFSGEGFSGENLSGEGFSGEGFSKFCTSTCIITWPGGGCMHYLSPFRLWRAATGDRKKYAAEIVQLCEEAIKKENQRSLAQARQGETK